MYFALALILVVQKRRFALSAGSCIPFHSHQGEREKNEYSYDAARVDKSYQNLAQIKL